MGLAIFVAYFSRVGSLNENQVWSEKALLLSYITKDFRRDPDAQDQMIRSVCERIEWLSYEYSTQDLEEYELLAPSETIALLKTRNRDLCSEYWSLLQERYELQ